MYSCIRCRKEDFCAIVSEDGSGAFLPPMVTTECEYLSTPRKMSNECISALCPALGPDNSVGSRIISPSSSLSYLSTASLSPSKTHFLLFESHPANHGLTSL